jgi:hypothetical protein
MVEERVTTENRLRLALTMANRQDAFIRQLPGFGSVIEFV